ncbi:NIL domain-containing protein, partial [Escherichia sp. R-CC3]
MMPNLTPPAQKFIQSTLHLDIPEDYQERLQAEPFTDCVPMLRLEFTGQSVDAPLLSETARRFNVNNNIISAQMDYASGVFGCENTSLTVSCSISSPLLMTATQSQIRFTTSISW